MSSNEISIQFNGKALAVNEGTTITALLQLAEIRSNLVAVEVNQAIVPHEKHSEHQLQQDDTVEAVTLVGGG